MSGAICFNIIYTPGTVKYLRLFVLSLLKWSPCSFRLVANGCSPEEKGLLKSLCLLNPRLQFLALPFAGIVEHSQALAYLQSIEETDYFAYIDSDVLARGDFEAEIAPHLATHSAVFSAPPIWISRKDTILPDGYQIVAGRYAQTETGLCLGSTSFGVYDNHVLSQFTQDSGVKFERYLWKEIPPPHQARLARLGMKKAQYDTGKVLNLLLQEQGQQFYYLPGETLIHLGGVSAHLKLALERGDRRKPLASLLLTYAYRHLKNRARMLLGLPINSSDLASVGVAEHLSRLSLRTAKPATSLYFYQLLAALFESQPLPAQPRLANSQADARLTSATREICALYQKYGPQLVGN